MNEVKLTVEEILERQDLSGMDLSGMSLGAANLRGKNLRGADLRSAHLGAADLSGADLRNANLQKANLGAATLRGADLRYCDVRDTNLVGADLEGADTRETLGLTIEAPVPLAHLIKPVKLEETEEFNAARGRGYHPLNHWGERYVIDGGHTLYKNETVWVQFKKQLGDAIFGDRQIYREVKLVQQYQQYSQWAYMISKRGFLRIANSLGLKVTAK